MLEVLNSDYIRTARAKGLSERTVINRHAFRNTLIPLITIMGTTLPALFSGALITETLFGIRGIGYTSYYAMINGDIPFTMFYLAFISILTLLSNLLADVLYAVSTRASACIERGGRHMANNERRSDSLNEALKRREAAGEQHVHHEGEPLALDDTQRVKVLSPGRLVAKRFFRNKLAIVGLAILIFMFVFRVHLPAVLPLHADADLL